MGKTHNKIQKRPRVVHRSPKSTVAQQQICVIQTGGPIRESLSMCSMRNFSKPDLWCLMTCKKRNATAGSVHVLSFWLGADWAAKERRESLSETEKKPSKQPVPRFFWEGSLSYEFPKNQPIFTTNKVPQELLAVFWCWKQVTYICDDILNFWAARFCFKGVSHGNHQKWLRVDFDEFRSPTKNTCIHNIIVSAILHQKTYDFLAQ